MPTAASFSTDPLIAVRNLRETVRAGFGSAMASVRTLDDVSVEVHAGELLVVESAAFNGAGALYSALAGAGRGVAGERHVGAGVQLRRGSIPASARDAIIATWAQGAWAALSEARVVYLLRVRAGPPIAPSRAAHDAWHDWATAVRGNNGAVVLFDTSRDVMRRMPAERTRAARVAEPSQGCTTMRESVTRGRLRTLTLSAGRIVAECSPLVVPLTGSPCGDSGASPSPIACVRCSTGSTAPSCRGDGASR